MNVKKYDNVMLYEDSRIYKVTNVDKDTFDAVIDREIGNLYRFNCPIENIEKVVDLKGE